MGNALSPCFTTKSSSSVTLIIWEGTTKTLTGPGPTANHRIAGEIMFEFPDKMVCHADSFFLGRPVPSLAIDDRLISSETYFVLPIDLFPSSALSAASLTAAASPSRPGPMEFGESGPFEYVKGRGGRVLVKVSPEFIVKNIVCRSEGSENGGKFENSGGECNNGVLCSTPELQKQYEQLVGCKEQVWSPKLETISEHRVRFSPLRLIGLEKRSR